MEYGHCARCGGKKKYFQLSSDTARHWCGIPHGADTHFQGQEYAGCKASPTFAARTYGLSSRLNSPRITILLAKTIMKLAAIPQCSVTPLGSNKRCKYYGSNTTRLFHCLARCPASGPILKGSCNRCPSPPILRRRSRRPAWHLLTAGSFKQLFLRTNTILLDSNVALPQGVTHEHMSSAGNL